MHQTKIKLTMSTKLVSEFNNDDVYFHSPTFTDKGQKNVNLSYDKVSTNYANRILLQLCKDTSPLRAKWNLSVPREGDDTKRRNWEIVLDNDTLLGTFKRFDEYIMNYALEHSREWFKKDLNKDQIEARYKPIVKEPKENETLNYFIMKVNCPPAEKPTPIKKIECDGKTLVDGSIEDLTKDAEVVPIISISGIWFMSDSFGASISASKIIVKPIPKKNFMDHFHLENSYDMETEEPELEAKQVSSVELLVD